MTLDVEQVEGALVEIVDALNGDRVVGLGVRLVGDVIATSCRCLPRQAGRLRLPDPDAPSVPVLVRLRKPGAAVSASAVVAFANPFSGLALLQGAAAAGLDVPDELNPVLSVEALLEQLTEVEPVAGSPPAGPTRLCAGQGRWFEGAVHHATFAAADRPGLPDDLLPGAPVLDEAGRVLALVANGSASGPDAALVLLADELPGWVLRRAAHPDKTAHSSHRPPTV